MEEFDSVTGDYDFDARRFDALNNQFIQPDSVIQNVYDPQSLNHYSFERNNPYKYEDENGQSATPYHSIGTSLALLYLGDFSGAAKSFIGVMIPDFHSEESYYQTEFGLSYEDFHLGPRTEVMNDAKIEEELEQRAMDYVETGDTRYLHIYGDIIHPDLPGSGIGSTSKDKWTHRMGDLNPYNIIITFENTKEFVQEAKEKKSSQILNEGLSSFHYDFEKQLCYA